MNDLQPPRLSFVVVVYNMQREAPRTLHSLSTAYQRGVRAEDYEVLVVENGSTLPLQKAEVESHGPQFHYFYHATRNPSPVQAINETAAWSRGEWLAICIDGARMFTPGLIARVLEATRLHPCPVITPLAWHLGPDKQVRSILQGYNQAEEDRLLASIDWPRDGYRLFEISALAGNSNNGFFMPLAESCCLVMRRTLFDELGGYDLRFDLPGGGLTNLDFYRRACEHEDSGLIVLLGEGSFHQIHSGTSSNASGDAGTDLRETFREQYRQIRGRPFERPTKTPIFVGSMPPAMLRFVHHSCIRAAVPPPPPPPSWKTRIKHWLTRRAA